MEKCTRKTQSILEQFVYSRDQMIPLSLHYTVIPNILYFISSYKLEKKERWKGYSDLTTYSQKSLDIYRMLIATHRSAPDISANHPRLWHFKASAPHSPSHVNKCFASALQLFCLLSSVCYEVCLCKHWPDGNELTIKQWKLRASQIYISISCLFTQCCTLSRQFLLC